MTLKKSLDKLLQDEYNKIGNIIVEGNSNMKVLNDIEKEFLKIILESDNVDYEYRGFRDKFPPYIDAQIKGLFEKLKVYGYIARSDCFIDGTWDAVLTPLAINYFEKEEEYKTMNQNGLISIGTFNANGSNVTFGNVYDSNFNIDNSYQQIEKAIEDKAEEVDREELMATLDEVKDYIENISVVKTIGKNTGLFKKIGKHVQKYQWFYQMLINLIGNSVFNVMGGK